MAGPSVTYTFSNSTTADATHVNQNFTDLINGATDGTKDYSISALTCAGNATFNGNTVIGNASGDTLTITASLASSIAIGTTYSYDIGSATVGLRSVYLGSSDSAARSTRVIGAAVASSWTMTLPSAVPGGASYILESTTGGVTSWTSRTDLAVVSKTTTYTASRADDVILCSGSAFTVTLPAASDSKKKFVFKKTDSTASNIITIARAGSDTIDGATSTTLNTQYEAVVMVSDGASAWSIVSRTYPHIQNSFTPTGSWTTNTSYSGYWTRMGRFLRCQVKVAFTGAPDAGALTLTIPNSWTIASVFGDAWENFGSGKFNSGGTAYFHVQAGYSSTTAIYVTVMQASGGGFTQQATFTKTSPATVGNGDTIDITFDVPISGWN